MPIHKMFLPGTHNSGSYRTYEGHSSDTVFMRYLICQDENIWSQLVYGIRYLDIRIGYYPDQKEKFWLNHNYARINPISSLIEDLKMFLQSTLWPTQHDIRGEITKRLYILPRFPRSGRPGFPPIPNRIQSEDDREARATGRFARTSPWRVHGSKRIPN